MHTYIFKYVNFIIKINVLMKENEEKVGKREKLPTAFLPQNSHLIFLYVYFPNFISTVK